MTAQAALNDSSRFSSLQEEFLVENFLNSIGLEFKLFTII